MEHIPIAWPDLTGEDRGWPKSPRMDRWIRDFPLQRRPLFNVLLPRTEYLDRPTPASSSAAEIESNPHTLGAHFGALGQAYAELEEHEIALTPLGRKITVAQEAGGQDIEGRSPCVSSLKLRGSGLCTSRQGQPAQLQESPPDLTDCSHTTTKPSRFLGRALSLLHLD